MFIFFTFCHGLYLLYLCENSFLYFNYQFTFLHYSFKLEPSRCHQEELTGVKGRKTKILRIFFGYFMGFYDFMGQRRVWLLGIIEEEIGTLENLGNVMNRCEVIQI